MGAKVIVESTGKGDNSDVLHKRGSTQAANEATVERATLWGRLSHGFLRNDICVHKKHKAEAKGHNCHANTNQRGSKHDRGEASEEVVVVEKGKEEEVMELVIEKPAQTVLDTPEAGSAFALKSR